MSGLPFTRAERRALAKRVRRAFEAKFGSRPKGTGFVRMASALAGRWMDHPRAWMWVESWIRDAPEPNFYQSDEWRKVRYRALRRSDGCCQACGRSKRSDGVVLHVDHIKPRSHFPALALELSNLQVLCEDCNLGKGNSDSIDWRAR